MALAVDASSPALAFAQDLSAATTGAFNPPVCLLVACVGSNHYGTTTFNGANWAITNNGAALTWTLVKKYNNQDKGASSADGAIYVAPLAAARTGMTVTATVTPVSGTSDSAFIGLYCVTGADLVTPAGNSIAGNATTNNLTTPTLTSQAANSMMFAVAVDYSAAGLPVSSDLTEANGHQASGISFLTGYKTLGAAGSTATANLDAAGTANVNWSPYILAEIKAGSGVLAVAKSIATYDRPMKRRLLR